MDSSIRMLHTQAESNANNHKDPHKVEVDLNAVNITGDNYDYNDTHKNLNHRSIKQSGQLQKKTCRWLNLSKTLLALLVTKISSSDSIQEEGGLASFFDAMEWKMNRRINEEEFTILYNEWINHSNSITGSFNLDKTSRSDLFTSNIQFVRQVLIDRNCSENKLDVYIASILHQNNLILTNFPVSYIMRDHIMKNPSNLELCTEKWLLMCEELFFTLDTHGYGYLQFDDTFFFCGCLVLGLGDQSDIYHHLELIQLTGMTIQFIMDATDSLYDFVPLPMFKRYTTAYSYNTECILFSIEWHNVLIWTIFASYVVILKSNTNTL